MVFTTSLLILFCVALAVSSLGFKKYIWFISIGYGFSIAAEGVAMLIMFPQNPLTIAACLLFVVYGCRLGGYLAYREFKSGSYAAHMKGEVKEDVPFGVKIAIWITCALLYLLQVLPILYRFENGAPNNIWLAVGLAIMVCGIVLVCYLLWRVETLSDLSISNLAEEEVPAMAEMDYEKSSEHANTGTPEDGRKSLSPCGDGSSAKVLSDASFEEIGSLLQQHCIDTELYLQHDLNAAQLAHVLGTNRFDLSMYFARQGTTYNAYINDLRIRHFVRLYYAAVAARRPFTTRQLAADSGYHSYSTFSLAFKQRMGQSVTVWMHDAES